jgi:hypothetical protein
VAHESDSKWLEIIGKALSYLCVQEFSRNETEAKPDLVQKVQFLERLGFTTAEAAVMMGSTANSVKTNLRKRASKKAKTSGKKTKK